MKRPSTRVTWTIATFCLTMFICWMGGIDIFQRSGTTGVTWLGSCGTALICWTWPGFWND